MSNQIDAIWDGDKHYGLAFGLINEKGAATGGLGSEGAFDWGGYFNTQYFADPKEQLIGVLLKQTQGPVNDETGCVHLGRWFSLLLMINCAIIDFIRILYIV
ncbi:MAG: CubicO group peptidase (beta-lactamase class C family) [Maribacter sp.]|jgi:CubicO group peptidase (beta-lactamase class C family)